MATVGGGNPGRLISSVLVWCDDRHTGLALGSTIAYEAPWRRIVLATREPDLVRALAQRVYSAILVVESERSRYTATSLCKKIRQADEQTPIVVALPTAEPLAGVSVIHAGADDCVIFPLARPHELLEQLCIAVHRRHVQKSLWLRSASSTSSVFHGLLSSEMTELNFRGVRIPLSVHQWRLLNCLCVNGGRVVPAALLSRQAGLQENGSQANLQNEVSRLRKRLRNIPALRIVTVRGYGYSLEIDVPSLEYLAVDEARPKFVNANDTATLDIL